MHLMFAIYEYKKPELIKMIKSGYELFFLSAGYNALFFLIVVKGVIVKLFEIEEFG